jgi:predicted dehydrogenase/MoaA/NifB/PqqE/SkfB family radical SAM enzyme/UDP-N-acetylglucosamine pyrophosphorylase
MRHYSSSNELDVYEKFGGDINRENILRKKYISGNLKHPSIHGRIEIVNENDVINLKKIDDNEKNRLINIGRQLSSASLIPCGGRARRMKEAIKTKAPLKAVDIDGKNMSFLELALSNNLYSRITYGTKIEQFIMTSFINNDLIRNELKKKKYYGLPPEEVHIFTQGIIHAIVPTTESIKENYEDKVLSGEIDRHTYDEILEYVRKNQGEIFEVKGDKLASYTTPGHMDILLWLIRSGLWLIFFKNDIKYLFIKNIDNAAATIDDDYFLMLGILEESNNNVLLEITKRPTGQTGGSIVKVDGILQSIPDSVVKKFGINPEEIPFMNTANYYIKIQEVLKNILHINDNDIEKIMHMSDADRISLFNDMSYKLSESYPVYPVMREVNDKPMIQFEQDFNDIATSQGVNLMTVEVPSIADAEDKSLSVEDISHIRFTPTKDMKDLIRNKPVWRSKLTSLVINIPGKDFFSILNNIKKLIIKTKIPSGITEVELLDVIMILLVHPEMKCEDIMSRLKITKDKLLSVFSYIKNNKTLQSIIINDSKYSEFTKSMSELITKKNGYLRKFLNLEVSYPFILEVHLGSICNSNCVQCFSHRINYIEINKKEPTIEKDTLIKLFDECRRNGVEEIWFSGGKEPFMSPLTFNAIKRANELGFRTRIYTNGEFLDTDSKKEVIMGCQQIRISINGNDSKTYDSIHFPKDGSSCKEFHNRAGHGVFYKVIENVKKLVAMKKKTNSRVKIAVSQVIQPKNYSGLEKFVDLAMELGVDSVQIRGESVGNVRPFTEKEKKNIIEQVTRIYQNQMKGKYGNLEIELRGVTREEMSAKKTISQFLPGMKKPDVCLACTLKRGLNPFGSVHSCEYAGHPQHAIQYPHLRLGNIKDDNLEDILKKNIGNYPKLCLICQAHEYAYNIILDKIKSDEENGIFIEDQPFYIPTKIALVGAGRWGSGPILNTLRAEFSGVEIYVLARSNFDELRKKWASDKYITIKHVDDFDDILSNTDIKSVIITTPFNTHYELVKKSLIMGKDVFVEKPVATTYEEAEELVKLANKKNLMLVAGYEFMYDPDVITLKSIVNDGTFWDIKKIEMTMLNPIEDRKLDATSNVIKDLGVHMLSILHFLLGPDKNAKIFNVILDKEKSTINLNWKGIQVLIKLDRNYEKEERHRHIIVTGTKSIVDLDYQNGKFEVKDTNGNLISSDNKKYPRILFKRAKSYKTSLQIQFNDFMDCLKTRIPPLSSVALTLEICKIIDEIDKIGINNKKQ